MAYSTPHGSRSCPRRSQGPNPADPRGGLGAGSGRQGRASGIIIWLEASVAVFYQVIAPMIREVRVKVFYRRNVVMDVTVNQAAPGLVLGCARS